MNSALSMQNKLNDSRKGGVKILIASGGSGGHIFPAIALARRLKDIRRDIGISFVATDKILDRKILEKEGFKFHLLSSNKLPYKISFQFAAFFIKLLYDMAKAVIIMLKYRPDVVVGFGGYVSCPMVLISRLFNVPRIVHEQNVVPGRANRFLFRFADRIAISFEDTKKFIGPLVEKAVLTGNPIRIETLSQRIERCDRRNSTRRFGLDVNKFTILVMGGSQGSHSLNDAFINALYKFDGATKSALQVIHITGIRDYEWVKTAYESLGLEHRVYSFIDRIEDAYGASDLILTRSGASAIFEIAFFGRPMILVPYPLAMSHQAENAKAFSGKGAAIEIDDEELSAEVVRNKISDLLNDRDKLKKLARSAKGLSIPGASSNLAEQVLNLARR